jgi:hypothetical protein
MIQHTEMRGTKTEDILCKQFDIIGFTNAVLSYIVISDWLLCYEMSGTQHIHIMWHRTEHILLLTFLLNSQEILKDNGENGALTEMSFSTFTVMEENPNLY